MFEKQQGKILDAYVALGNVLPAIEQITETFQENRNFMPSFAFFQWIIHEKNIVSFQKLIG